MLYPGSEEVFLNLYGGETLVAFQNKPPSAFQVQGLQNVSFSHQNQESANLLLVSGARKLQRNTVAPPSIQCSFSKPYINSIDELPTGRLLSGEFIYGTGVLGFDDACISSLSVSVDPESTPTISCTLDIYGDFKPITVTGTSTNKETITSFIRHEYDFVSNDADSTVRTGFLPRLSHEPTGVIEAMTLSVSKDKAFGMFPIEAFDYNVSFDFRPTYEIDSIKSSTVKLVNPISITSETLIAVSGGSRGLLSNATGIAATGYEMFDIQGDLNTNFYKRADTITLQVTIGGKTDSLKVPDAIMVDESISTDVSNITKLRFSHQGYMIATY